MRIFYIHPNQSLLRALFRKLPFKVEFIDDLPPYNHINYTSDDDYVKRSKRVLPIIKKLLYIIRDSLKIQTSDISDPDWAYEGDYFIRPIESLLDISHIKNYIESSEHKKIIIVRRLRDFSFLFYSLKFRKPKVILIYIPSVSSAFDFFRLIKPQLTTFIHLFLSSIKSVKKDDIASSILVHIDSLPQRRVEVYEKLIESFLELGISFMFLSTNNKNSFIIFNSKKYKLLNLFNYSSVFVFFKVLTTHSIGILKASLKILKSNSFPHYLKSHLFVYTLIYMYFDVLPRKIFDEGLKEIKIKQKNIILISWLDYSRYSRIVNRIFKTKSNTLKLLRIPFHDNPYGVVNPFFDNYEILHDATFKTYKTQPSFSKKSKKTYDFDIGFPYFENPYNRVNKHQSNFKLLIDFSPFGNGYYIPKSLDRLIELVFFISRNSDPSQLEITCSFHQSFQIYIFNKISEYLSKDPNLKLMSPNFNQSDRRLYFTHADIIISSISNIGFNQLINNKHALILQHIQNENFSFLNQIYTKTYTDFEEINNHIKMIISSNSSSSSSIPQPINSLNQSIRNALVSENIHKDKIKEAILKIISIDLQN